MRKLAVAFLVFVAIVAAGVFWTRDTGAADAYAAAEVRIAEAIEDDARVLKLSDLTALTELPPAITGLENLIQLTLDGTQVSDISELAGLPALKYLNLRRTRVLDLGPVSALEDLLILDLGGAWVTDLEPLTALPRLERLGLGQTQLRSLEPATRIQGLKWVNLHGAYALDGSKAHFEALETAGVEVNNGRAFREDYRPDWMYRSKVRFARAKARLGLGTSG